MSDFTVVGNDFPGKLAYLIEKIKVMNNAIDNEMPDEALWELRRTLAAIERWNVPDQADI